MAKMIKGTIELKSVEEKDVAYITSEHFTLVYYPEAEGTAKVFWAKRMKNIILFDYITKEEVDIATVEHLYKLIFIEKRNKKEHAFKYSQWRHAIIDKKVNTDVVMTGYETKGGVIRIDMRDPIPVETVYAKLRKSFSSMGDVQRLIESSGYRLTPA